MIEITQVWESEGPRRGPGPATHKASDLGREPGLAFLSGEREVNSTGGEMRDWLSSAGSGRGAWRFLDRPCLQTWLSGSLGLNLAQERRGTGTGRKGPGWASEVLTWLAGQAADRWGKPTDHSRCQKWCRPCLEPPASGGESHLR